MTSIASTPDNSKEKEEEQEIRMYCKKRVADSILVVFKLLRCKKLSDLYDDEVKDHGTFKRLLIVAKNALVDGTMTRLSTAIYSKLALAVKHYEDNIAYKERQKVVRLNAIKEDLDVMEDLIAEVTFDHTSDGTGMLVKTNGVITCNTKDHTVIISPKPSKSTTVIDLMDEDDKAELYSIHEDGGIIGDGNVEEVKPLTEELYTDDELLRDRLETWDQDNQVELESYRRDKKRLKTLQTCTGQKPPLDITKTIQSRVMVSDTVIQSFLEIIKKNSNDMRQYFPTSPRDHFFDPAFYNCLMGGTYTYETYNFDTLKKKTHYMLNPYVGIRTLFIPLFTALHFTFVAINMFTNVITYYDSIRSSHKSTQSKHLTMIKQYLNDIAEAHGEKVVTFKSVVDENFPQQDGSVDCAFFTLLGIDLLSNNVSIPKRVTVRQIVNYRNRIAKSFFEDKTYYPFLSNPFVCTGFFQGYPKLKTQLRGGSEGSSPIDYTVTSYMEHVAPIIFALILAGRITSILHYGAGGGREILNLVLACFRLLDREVFEKLQFIACELYAAKEIFDNSLTVLNDMKANYHSEYEYFSYKCLYYMMGFDSNNFEFDTPAFTDIFMNSETLFYSIATVNAPYYFLSLMNCFKGKIKYYVVAKRWIEEVEDKSPLFVENVALQLIIGPTLSSSTSLKLMFFTINETLREKLIIDFQKCYEWAVETENERAAKSIAPPTVKRSTLNSLEAEVNVVDLPRLLNTLDHENLSRMPSFVDCEIKDRDVKVIPSNCLEELRTKLLIKNDSSITNMSTSIIIKPFRRGLVNTGGRICWLISLVQFFLRLRCVTSFSIISFEDSIVQSCMLYLMEYICNSNISAYPVQIVTKLIIDTLLQPDERSLQQDAHLMLGAMLTQRDFTNPCIVTTEHFFCSRCNSATNRSENEEIYGVVAYDFIIGVEGLKNSTVNIKDYLSDYGATPIEFSPSKPAKKCTRCDESASKKEYRLRSLSITNEFFICRLEIRDNTLNLVENLKFELSLNVNLNQQSFKLVSVMFVSSAADREAGHYFTVFTDDDRDWFIGDDNRVRHFCTRDNSEYSNNNLDYSSIGHNYGDPYMLLYIKTDLYAIDVVEENKAILEEFNSSHHIRVPAIKRSRGDEEGETRASNEKKKEKVAKGKKFGGGATRRQFNKNTKRTTTINKKEVKRGTKKQ